MWSVDKNLAGYARIFSRTLVHPTASFQPMQTSSINSIPGKAQDLLAPDNTGSWLQLSAFVLISVFLGSIINFLVPARKYSCDIVDKITVLSFFWLGVVACMHPLCRMFRGRANPTQTDYVSLHVVSTLFVVSSVISLVGGVFVRHPQVSSSLGSIGRLGDSIANNPVYIYFLTHCALFNVYLPLAVKAIHGFGWFRTIMIAIVLSSFWALFAIVFSSNIGVIYLKT